MNIDPGAMQNQAVHNSVYSRNDAGSDVERSGISAHGPAAHGGLVIGIHARDGTGGGRYPLRPYTVARDSDTAGGDGIRAATQQYLSPALCRAVHATSPRRNDQAVENIG